MRKQNYNKTNMTYELQVIDALTNKTATKEMLNDIISDVQNHLDNNPVGTLDNYCGRFTQAGLKALQDNYNIFDGERIQNSKIFDIVNLLGNKLFKNQEVKLHISAINLILDYIKGKDNEANNDASKYIIVGYPTSKIGNKTLPEAIDNE